MFADCNFAQLYNIIVIHGIAHTVFARSDAAATIYFIA